MACKAVAKSLFDGVVQLVILCIFNQENRLRFRNSENCFFSQGMNNHIIRLSSLRVLVVAIFVVHAEFKNVNWSLVATLLLGNSICQTYGNKDL